MLFVFLFPRVMHPWLWGLGTQQQSPDLLKKHNNKNDAFNISEVIYQVNIKYPNIETTALESSNFKMSREHTKARVDMKIVPKVK